MGLFGSRSNNNNAPVAPAAPAAAPANATPAPKRPKEPKDNSASTAINLFTQLAKIKAENPNIKEDATLLSTLLKGVMTTISEIKIVPKQLKNIKLISESGVINLLNSLNKINEIPNKFAVMDAVDAFVYTLENMDFSGVTPEMVEAIKRFQESGITNVLKSFNGDFDVDKVGIRDSIGTIKEVIKELSDIQYKGNDIPGLTLIKDIVSALNDMELDFTTPIKIFMLVNTIKYVIKSMNEIGQMDTSNVSNVDIEPLISLSTDLENIKASPLIFPKLILIRLAVKMIQKLFTDIGEFPSTGKSSVKGIIDVLSPILSLIQQVNNVKIDLLFGLKIKIIRKAVGKIKSVVEYISTEMQFEPGAVKKVQRGLAPVVEILNSMMSIMKTLMLMVPIGLLFLALSPVIIMVFFLVGMALKAIVSIIKFVMVGVPKTVFVQFTGLVLGLIALNILLLLLALSGVYLLKSAMVIIGTLLFMGLFVLALSLFLMAIGLVAPFLAAGTVSILLVAISVLAILIVMAALWLIGKFELDEEAIRQNIEIVFRVSDQLFEFCTIGNLWDSAVLMTAMVFMTIGVLGILLIVTFLRILQELDLDANKIMENVKVVVDTCKAILDILFGKDDEKAKSKNASVLEYLGDYLGSRLKLVTDAFASMAMLISMALAVAGILFLATILRVLAEFDKDKIAQGGEVAALVMMVCGEIMNIVYGDREMPEKGERPEGIESIFSGHFPSFWETVVSFTKLIPIVLAIGMVMLLALMIRGLAVMDDRSGEALAKVSSLMFNIDRIVSAILNPQDPKKGEPSDRNLLTELVDLAAGLLDDIGTIIGTLSKLGSLGVVFIVLKLITGIANKLNVLGSMNVGTFQKARTNVNTLMNQVNDIVKVLLNSDGPGFVDSARLSIWASSMGTLANSLDKLVKIGGSLEKFQKIKLNKEQIVSQLDAIKAIGVPDTNVQGIDKLLEVSDKLVKISSNGGRANVESLVNSLRDLGSASFGNIDSITNSYGRFMDKINSTNAEKLQTTANMMKSWAELSKSISGNFDGLARSLNEHILPALKELNDTMDDVMETLQAANTQRAEIYADQNGAKGDTNKIAAQPGATPTQPGATPVPMNETTKRVKDAQMKLKQAQLNANSVADILLSGEAIVRIKS